MSDPHIAALVQVRQAQTGAAIGALGCHGVVLKPLFSVFGAELLTDFALSSRAGFDVLRLSTRAHGAFAHERLEGLLNEVYGTHPKVGNLARKLGEHFEQRAFHLTIEDHVDGSREPGLEISWEGSWTDVQLAELLEFLDVGAAARDAFAAMRGRLLLGEATRFGFRMAAPGAPPIFEATFPAYFAKPDRPAWEAQLGLAVDLIDVPAAQKKWALGTVKHFAPRELNRTFVRIATGHDALEKELRVTYPLLPTRLLLKVLAQLQPSDHMGSKLGAMTAAVGLEQDIVHAMHVTLRDRDPVGLDFELRAMDPPGVARA